MGSRKGSTVRKTRSVMKKHFRQKGKISITRYFAEYKPGEKVCLKIDSGVQKGTPELRFYGRQGVVKGKRGGCYEVEMFDGGKKKKLIINPMHLARLK